MTQWLNDIWCGVLDKNPESWSKLVRRLEPLVYSAARRIGLSLGEADDCVQETWIALYRSRHRIKDPSRIPSWLVRTASRGAVRMARRRDRDIEGDEGTHTVSSGSLPDEELERLETAALVRLALDSMEPRCRRLLHALYLAPATKKYHQISRELGIPPNSFGPTRSRCLKKLRQILTRLGCEFVLNGPDHDSAK